MYGCRSAICGRRAAIDVARTDCLKHAMLACISHRLDSSLSSPATCSSASNLAVWSPSTSCGSSTDSMRMEVAVSSPSEIRISSASTETFDSWLSPSIDEVIS